MYIDGMSHRIQITITDEQYAFLDGEADASSLSIAELVRRAIDTTYALADATSMTVIEHTAGRRTGRRIDPKGSWHRHSVRWRTNR